MHLVVNRVIQVDARVRLRPHEQLDLRQARGSFGGRYAPKENASVCRTDVGWANEFVKSVDQPR